MNRFLLLVMSTAFRLLLWLLLTDDGRPVNLVIGLIVALLLPRARTAAMPWRDLVQAFGACLVAIPRAYIEAFLLIVRPRDEEREVSVATHGPAVPLLIFFDVFRITLTPFTIALGMTDAGQSLRVHELVRGRREAP
jgi:multicomponent Na+:H+ antiporter subunit E